MSQWNRMGILAAGLVVGLAGCRHSCAERVRKPDCDPCAPPRYAAVPPPTAACPDCPPVSAMRQPAVGVPVSATVLPGPFGPPAGSVPGPFAPTIPTPGLPNELPPPAETIPAPTVPLPAAPTAANVLPPPGSTRPVSQPK